MLAGMAAAMMLAAPGLLKSQNLLPNGDLEQGDATPAQWRFSGAGQGMWANQAHTGRRAVTVVGDGKTSGFWRSELVKLGPGEVYQFKFWGRRAADTSGGCVVSGSASVNRDFRFSESWAPYAFYFTPPVYGTNEYLRLGQWEQQGTVFFDDASLTKVLPVHTRAGGLELGDGESIAAGEYHCRVNLGGPGANYHRTLWINRCGFNSDRWTFGNNAEVVYRHEAPGGFKSARVKVTVNYFIGGKLQVSASANGADWQLLGAIDSARSSEFEVPEAALTSEALFIRLAGEGPNCNLQVNNYDLTAPLKQTLPDAQSRTAFFEVLQSSSNLSVRITGTDWNAAQGGQAVHFRLQNESPAPLDLRALLAEEKPNRLPTKLAPLATGATLSTSLVFQASQPGNQTVTLSVMDARGQSMFTAQTALNVGFLNDPRPGYWLAETPALGLWWCESGWKIGRERGLPARLAKTKPVTVTAARGEFEAAQVILRPRQDIELLSASISALRDRRQRPANISVELLEVAYVRVTRPTDNTCEPGWYPDPLPPLRTPLKITANANQPLWLNFRVGRDVAAGDYTGELRLQTTTGPVTMPVNVEVYDFELPRETHLKSAFGLGTGEINRYHGLTNTAQRQEVYDKYLTHFAEHRIAPYSFFAYAPLDIKFVGSGAEKRAQIDFTKFDQAARRWLDEQRLSTFMLPLRGMGGGTFHSRHLGELEGFKEGTPEHARLFQDYLSQVERHLKDNGWLDKAYTYWFDEPDPKDYEFVTDGMKRIKSAAPGLRRMLTEQPEKELLGHVEIWCGLTPEWTPEKVSARRAAGEEVWWYICCAPHAPYVTEFIDHPGLELRLWPWQSWQYGVQGILVWASTYWSSSAAFPAPQRQDPWADPMSYVSGYDFKPGHIGYWGNGDGRFLYPPRRAANDSNPNLDGPVTSFRWENLRDGMEDYEYLWMLRSLVERRQQAGRQTALLREAEALLRVPETISKDTRNFTSDPRPLLEHRERVARMIERLNR